MEIIFPANNKTRRSIFSFKTTAPKNNQYTLPNVYFEEAIFQGPDLFNFVLRNFGDRSTLQKVMGSEDEEKIEAAKKGVLDAAPAYFKDYNQEIDENLLASMLEMFYNNVDVAYHPATLTTIGTKYKGNFKAFAAKYYAKSPFSSEENLTTKRPNTGQIPAKDYNKIIGKKSKTNIAFNKQLSIGDIL